MIVNVTWVNEPPKAEAGPKQEIRETLDGQPVTVILDGSASDDPDDGIAAYEWIQTSGSPVELSDPDSKQARFTAPNVGIGGETLNFQLTVTDFSGLKSTDSVSVNILWENIPPHADAGEDRNIREDDGETVTLDGSGSVDDDDGIVSYQWTQISGDDVTLNNPTSFKTEFEIPDVKPEGASLEFMLTVTDRGGLEDSDTVLLNIVWEDEPPTAIIKDCPKQVYEEETVTLDGSESEDPDGENITFQWTQDNGSLVDLSDSQGEVVSFTAPIVPSGTETLTFKLTVTDAEGSENAALQSQATCTVEVGLNDAPETEDQSVTIQEDEPVIITLEAYDKNNDSVTYKIVTRPEHGELSEELAYTPNENYFGSDSFTFTANDGKIESNPSTVHITIEAVNDAPVISDDAHPTAEVDAYEEYRFTPSVSDPDPDDTLTFSIENKPEWAEFDETTGRLSGRPTNEYAGTTSALITITVKDKAGAVASLDPFDITVRTISNVPPDRPDLVSPSDEYFFAPGESVTLAAGEFSDNDGDAHLRSHWQVTRSDGDEITAEDVDDLTTYTLPESFITPGLKYSWKVQYEDEREGVSQWSEESVFKIGEVSSVHTWENDGIGIQAGKEPADFPMVSFTFWPDNPECADVFQEVFEQVTDGIYDTKFLRIGTYAPDKGGYTECGGMPIQPGKAYWFFTLKNVDGISFKGIPVSTAHDFDVELAYNLETNDGWNMIACPNAADYSWDDLEVLQYNEDGTVKDGYPVTLSSDDNDLVDKRLWRWNKGEYVYYHPTDLGIEGYDPDPDPDPSLMKRNEGYWVKAMAENVVLRFTTEAQRNSRAAPRMTRGKESDGDVMIEMADGPPAPMSTFASAREASDSSGGGSVGCFIATADQGTAQTSANQIHKGMLIFILSVISIAGIIYLGRKMRP